METYLFKLLAGKRLAPNSLESYPYALADLLDLGSQDLERVAELRAKLEPFGDEPGARIKTRLLQAQTAATENDLLLIGAVAYLKCITDSLKPHFSKLPAEFEPYVFLAEDLGDTLQSCWSGSSRGFLQQISLDAPPALLNASLAALEGMINAGFRLSEPEKQQLVSLLDGQGPLLSGLLVVRVLKAAGINTYSSENERAEGLLTLVEDTFRAS